MVPDNPIIKPTDEISRLSFQLSPPRFVEMIVMLYLQGRLWWCKFGDHAIYVNEA
jgi:hypothetical protein